MCVRRASGAFWCSLSSLLIAAFASSVQVCRVNVALAFAAFGIVERLDRFPQVGGLYVAVRVEGHAFGGAFRNQYSVRRRYMKSRVAVEYFGIVSSEKALDLFAFAD